MIMIHDILEILSDENRLRLFLNNGQVTNLSRKKYFDGLHQLKEAGLLRRVGIRKYEPTAIGLVMRKVLDLMDRAVKLEHKLNAYDECLIQYKNIPADHWAEKLFDNAGDEEILSLLIMEQRVKAGVSYRI